MRPGDKYLACDDCDYVVELAHNGSPLAAIGRHTTSRHERRPTNGERTPRTWVATAHDS